MIVFIGIFVVAVSDKPENATKAIANKTTEQSATEITEINPPLISIGESETIEITTDLTGYNTQTYENGDKYAGNFVSGIRSGDGTYEWANGIIYNGEFVNGEPNGNGDYIYPTEAETTRTIKQSATVYITKSGDKYHRAGCRYLKNGGTAISKEAAQNKGYTACKVCGGG